MGKRKANDDPTRPKGKITAYAFFIRYKHEQKDPTMANLPFSEFSKRCSDEWKSSDETAREAFIQMARDDKVRFDEEIGVWKANGGMQKAKAAKRAAKDVNEPKRPQTAFFLFSCEYRDQIKANNPEFKVTDVARELGRMWREADADTKSYFAKLAERKKEEYVKELEEYKIKKKDEDAKKAEEARVQQREQQAQQRVLEKQQQRQAQEDQRRKEMDAQRQQQEAAAQRTQQQIQQQQIQQQLQQQNMQQVQQHQIQRVVQQVHPQQVQQIQYMTTANGQQVQYVVPQQQQQQPQQPLQHQVYHTLQQGGQQVIQQSNQQPQNATIYHAPQQQYYQYHQQ